MRKLILFCLAIFTIATINAQDFPYSKYLNYGKDEFKENKFKYDDYTNTWTLSKTNGGRTFVNIMAIIADAEEDVRPAKNDYSIVVQLGEDDKVASVIVVFYKDETYHKLLTFLTEDAQNLIQTSSNRITKHHAKYGEYDLELEMEQHIISRTSMRTADFKTVKNVDESYNKYEFKINTGVVASSKYLDKKAKKEAKRDAKGKKKIDVEDLM